MTAEIRNINALRAAKENDNSLLSPIECLEDAAQDIRSGERKCTRLMVLTLDDSDGYNVGFYCQNMKQSEAISLMEVAKTLFLKNMGYL